MSLAFDICLDNSQFYCLTLCMLGNFSRYRGYYMSAHVLLNLLNKLRKRDQMQGLPSVSSLFLIKFNKFNNTEA